MNKCDYIPSNIILIHSSFMSVITNDLSMHSGKYIYDFSDTNIFDKPLLSNIRIVMENGRLKIVGEVSIPFSEVTLIILGGETINIKVSESGFSQILNSNVSIDSEISIKAVSPSLVQGDEYILKYDFLAPVLDNVKILVENESIYVAGYSTDTKATIRIAINNIDTLTEMASESYFKIKLPLNKYKGRIEIYAIDDFNNKSNVIALSLESISIFTDILVKSKSYIDGFDLLSDKAGMK